MSSYNVVPFIQSGFLAGITPCALSLVALFIVFFMHTVYAPKEKKIIGIIFVVSVFVTYYFLELGAFEGFRRLEVFEILAKVFYLLLGALSVLLGLMHMYDWVMLKKQRDASKILLKFFPAVFKISSKHTPVYWIKLLVFAGMAGFAVALLSSLCRGYLNLSSVISLVTADQIKVKTVVYNALYNIMSILPLIVAFCILQSKRFQSAFQKHAVKAKTVSAGVLLGLGCGLLFMFSR